MVYMLYAENQKCPPTRATPRMSKRTIDAVAWRHKFPQRGLKDTNIYNNSTKKGAIMIPTWQRNRQWERHVNKQCKAKDKYMFASRFGSRLD